MLIVPRKRICTQQPQQFVQAESWITDAFIPMGGTFVNVGNGQKAARFSTDTGTTFGVGKFGRCGVFNGASYSKLGPATGLAGGLSLTFGVVFESTGNPVGVPGVFGKADYYDDGFALLQNASNSYRFLFKAGGSVYKSDDFYPGQGVHTAVATLRDGVVYYDIDGGVNSGSFACPGILATATQQLIIGAQPGYSRYFVGNVYLAFATPVSSSDSLIRKISALPWQIFLAPDGRIFVPTSAGGGTTDSLTASSIIAPPATVGSPLLSQKHTLSASSIATAPAVAASPSITQRHALSATAVSASPAVVASPTVTQKHAITAATISAAPAVVGLPTLTEIVAGTLSALPIVAAPAVVGAPTIGQKHALSAGAISAGPATFGTPTLTQQHALMAQGITAGVAVIGLPVLSEGGAVIFTSAPNGGGYSRAGENYTRPPQTNTVRN